MPDSNNKTFEQGVKSKRLLPNFSNEIPPIDLLNEIVKSCIHAPYAGALGIPLDEVRKVYIFKQNTDSMAMARDILLSEIKKNSRNINTLVKFFPSLKKRIKPFAYRLRVFSPNGIPLLFEAPFFIVIAEKKGFPMVNEESLTHALQNMWLTATNLGLEFQLITAIPLMAKNKQFLKLLKLKKGDYALDGCVVGYPYNHAEQDKECGFEKFVTWVE
ncbi:MAG: nitroreductase family protein [Bacteroidales bacterium]|nr:nitroreductase family protein [Bacteroidales bacterium]